MSPCVFVSKFVLPALRGQVWETKCYSDNDIHALHKPRYNRHNMFFYYDCATTNYQLDLRKYQFHHYKNCWFPTTSLHSPLLTHVHDSLSSELSHFLNKLSTKKNYCNFIFIFKYSVYTHPHDCYFLEHYPCQLKEFSSKVISWHLIHDQTKILSSRKICLISLCVSGFFFLLLFIIYFLLLLRLSVRTQENTFLLNLH